MTVRIRINELAVKRAIRTPAMRQALMKVGEEMAANIRAQGITVGDINGGSSEVPLPVNVYVDNGAEPKAVVVLSHAAGLAVQAKHGVLTKAAAAVGLRSDGGQA